MNLYGSLKSYNIFYEDHVKVNIPDIGLILTPPCFFLFDMLYVDYTIKLYYASGRWFCPLFFWYMNNEKKKIEDIVKPVIDSLGLELDEIEYITHGRKWILRIFIDKEGGVSLSDCEKVSFQLGNFLNNENIIPHAYILEVSSPGLDKRLKRLDEYLKYKGRLIRLNTTKPYNNRTSFKGRIISAEEGKIKIEAEKNGEVNILFSDIANAKLEVEF